MTRIAALAFALALLAPAPALPQPSLSPGEAAPAAPEAKIEAAAWLAGYWVGEGMGGTIEDLWMPPRNGVMLGSFRLNRTDGKRGFYELFAIEEFEGTLRFVVKHFHPDWVGWEEKDQALKIKLSRVSPDEIAFGGIVFQRAGPSELVVKVTLKSKGETRVERLVFRKVPI